MLLIEAVSLTLSVSWLRKGVAPAIWRSIVIMASSACVARATRQKQIRIVGRSRVFFTVGPGSCQTNRAFPTQNISCRGQLVNRAVLRGLGDLLQELARTTKASGKPIGVLLPEGRGKTVPVAVIL